jgi:hypothetical protein
MNLQFRNRQTEIIPEINIEVWCIRFQFGRMNSQQKIQRLAASWVNHDITANGLSTFDEGYRCGRWGFLGGGVWSHVVRRAFIWWEAARH